MGVKETPISDTADTADEDEGEENGEEQSEETPPEDSKQEEAPEDKPKRAKAKPEAKKKAEAKPEAKKKAEAKPKKKAEAKPEKKAEAKPKKEKKLEEHSEEEPEETPKPTKKAKKDTVDMKQKTMCSICKSEPISNDALLYSHSCKKEALAKRKKAPLFDEEPKEPSAQPAQGSAVGVPWRSGPATALSRQGGESLANPEAPPAPSYREILARQQQEMRRQKAARIVNPIRAHFFGYA